MIGVDPAHHGKGLGRALTIAGFSRLASLGLRNGMLYVAGNNSAAIALYESLGMRIVHRDEPVDVEVLGPGVGVGLRKEDTALLEKIRKG